MEAGMDSPSTKFPVLSPALAIPSQREFEQRFIAFLRHMRCSLGREARLKYADERFARKKGQQARERHLRECGLERLSETELDQLIRLAQVGSALTGPADLEEVDAWAAALHAAAPWMSDISTFLMRHMRRSVRAGNRGLSVPPIILVGPPGDGKTTFARLIAAVTEAPYRQIDVGSGSAAFRVTGLERGWKSAQSGLPVETVLNTGIANPLMIVNEIDKSTRPQSDSGTVPDLTTALMQMLEPETACRFECPFLRLRFDMSRVSWVMTANDLSPIAAPLRDRCAVFQLPEVTPHVAGQMFDTLAGGVPELDREVLQMARRSVVTAAERGGMSLRRIRRILEQLDTEPAALLH
jgi:hypothetical protein